VEAGPEILAVTGALLDGEPESVGVHLHAALYAYSLLVERSPRQVAEALFKELPADDHWIESLAPSLNELLADD
jgi:hypothetical protein